MAGGFCCCNVPVTVRGRAWQGLAGHRPHALHAQQTGTQQTNVQKAPLLERGFGLGGTLQGCPQVGPQRGSQGTEAQGAAPASSLCLVPAHWHLPERSLDTCLEA